MLCWPSWLASHILSGSGIIDCQSNGPDMQLAPKGRYLVTEKSTCSSPFTACPHVLRKSQFVYEEAMRGHSNRPYDQGVGHTPRAGIFFVNFRGFHVALGISVSTLAPLPSSTLSLSAPSRWVSRSADLATTALSWMIFSLSPPPGSWYAVCAC